MSSSSDGATGAESEPRRVAFFDQAAVAGGAELSMARLIRRLSPSKWQRTVILGERGPLMALVSEAGASTVLLELPSKVRMLRQGSLSLTSLLTPARMLEFVLYVVRLSSLIKRRQINLVHANSLKACVIAGLAARIAKVPCIWNVHSVVAGPMVSPTGRRAFAISAKLLANHVICNSEATALSVSVSRKRLSVVPPCMDLAPPSEASPWSRPVRVGVLARLSPIKGQDIFLQAAEMLAGEDAQFVVAGSPLFGEEGYAEALRATADRSLVSGRIEFVGFVEDARSYLQSLDIVVQPSTQPEGFGQVIAEAMAMGKTVIASNIGGTVGLIDDGVNGLLVPPRDAVALAKAIRSLLAERDYAAELGRRAMEQAAAFWDGDRVAEAVEAIYERVLATP